eukprot:jgi/Botrbrau1/10276/Bobra.0140s0029.1
MYAFPFCNGTDHRHSIALRVGSVEVYVMLFCKQSIRGQSSYAFESVGSQKSSFDDLHSIMSYTPHGVCLCLKYAG